MQCPACNQRLMIGQVTYAAVNDDTPDTPTEIYCIQPLICTNPQCALYGGNDLSKPEKVVETIKHRLN